MSHSVIFVLKLLLIVCPKFSSIIDYIQIDRSQKERYIPHLKKQKQAR
jgi:hypothetical protein